MDEVQAAGLPGQEKKSKLPEPKKKGKLPDLKKAAKKSEPEQDSKLPEPKRKKALSAYARFKEVLGNIIMTIYHFRKIVMAVPVAYVALRLAAYNMSNLPEEVGLNLQTTGEFAMHISRYAAVVGPLAITAGCLVMMFFSRKAMHSWAISIFSLALPLLLLLSNMYPA